MLTDPCPGAFLSTGVTPYAAISDLTYPTLSSAPACSVEKRTLGNGTTLLVDRSDSLRAFAFSISFLGGSRDETPETSGLTHLLEHLLFKRTRSKDTLRLACLMDEFGSEVNAFTDPDSFTLYGVVPRSRKLALMDLLAELVLEPAFNERDLEVEKDVIRQEILEAEDDPAELVLKEFSRLFWSGSSLSQPVYGSLESLESFAARDVYAHLSRSVVGSRILICASGEIHIDELSEYAERHFGKLPRGADRLIVAPSIGKGVSLVPKSSAQCQLRVGLPWTGMRDEDYLPGIVMATILGDCTSSRLFQKMREERGLAYDVSASLEAYHDVGGLIITAAVEKTSLLPALRLIGDELCAHRQTGLTVDELRRAKGMLSAQMEMQTDSARGRLWQLFECEMSVGRYVSNEEVAAKLEALSVEGLADVMLRRFGKIEALIVAGGDVEGFSCEQLTLGW